MLNKETTLEGWTGRQQEQKNCPVLEKEVFMLTEARHCNNDSHTADYHFKMHFYVVLWMWCILLFSGKSGNTVFCHHFLSETRWLLLKFFHLLWNQCIEPVWKKSSLSDPPNGTQINAKKDVSLLYEPEAVFLMRTLNLTNSVCICVCVYSISVFWWSVSTTWVSNYILPWCSRPHRPARQHSTCHRFIIFRCVCMTENERPQPDSDEVTCTCIRRCAPYMSLCIILPKKNLVINSDFCPHWHTELPKFVWTKPTNLTQK